MRTENLLGYWYVPFAPFLAKSSAIDFPIPLEAPVTTTNLPPRLIAMLDTKH